MGFQVVAVAAGGDCRGAGHLAELLVAEGRGEGGGPPRGVAGQCRRRGWAGAVGGEAVTGAEVTVANGVGPEARTAHPARVR